MSRSAHWRAARERIHQARLAAPFAVLGVAIEEDRLVGIDYLPRGTPSLAPRSLLAREACRQLRAYLQDPGFRFELPVHLSGTPFQRRVWEALRTIPSGETVSYAELARALCTSPRAVGSACGANPVPLVVPCHRVVATHGLGGFMHAREGVPLAIKRWLLIHERR
ncbi:MAG: methylated-DNA--[protein]-cysteine S-methyltransferase [Pseudomonadota bacterium]|jgi:methylated-DNA-[protein]-cysteine S-methyltransferase